MVLLILNCIRAHNKIMNFTGRNIRRRVYVRYISEIGQAHKYIHEIFNVLQSNDYNRLGKTATTVTAGLLLLENIKFKELVLRITKPTGLQSTTGIFPYVLIVQREPLTGRSFTHKVSESA